MIRRMKNRSTKWVLCAASGFFLAVPSTMSAQDSGPSPKTTMRSAIQRELDALYDEQGSSAPRMSTTAASQSVVATQQPQLLRSQASSTPRQLPVAQPAPTASQTSRSDQSRRFAGRVSRHRYQPSKKSSRATTNSIKPVQHQVARSPQGNSAIMNELQKMYDQDDRAMPAMNIPKQQAPPTAVAQSEKTSKPSLLKRMFSFGRKKKADPKPAAVPVPVPRQQKSASPQLVATPARMVPPPPESTRMEIPAKVVKNQIELSSDTVPRPVTPPEALPVPAAIESAEVETAEAVHPLEQLEAASQPKSTPESVPVVKNEGDFPNPFTEESEGEADQKIEENPFTGAVLDNVDETPATVEARPVEENTSAGPARTETKPSETSPAVKRSTTAAQKLAMIAEREGMTGLKGFCLVELRDQLDLVDTLPEFSSVHGLKTYFFSSADAKSRFDAAPEKYALAADGHDVVQLNLNDREQEGMLDFAAWYKGQLYLFSSAENKALFRANPAAFTSAASTASN